MFVCVRERRVWVGQCLVVNVRKGDMIKRYRGCVLINVCKCAVNVREVDISRE